MVTIRLATGDDAGGCRDIYAPYVRDTAISFEMDPPSVDEFEARLRSKREVYPWLVCEHENSVIGFAYASEYRSRDAYQWSVESSVYVSEDYHRTGVANGLYRSLFETLRRQGFYNVYAATKVPNPSSVNFHRGFGFEPMGVRRNVGYKQGAWHDVKWWHHTVQPHHDDPDPPTPIGELEGTADLAAAVRAGLEEISF